MTWTATATGDDPAKTANAVTPHDTNDLVTSARGLYVGSEGDVVVIMAGDSTNTAVTFVGASGVLPISVKRVLSTGTTASNIVALN